MVVGFSRRARVPIAHTIERGLPEQLVVFVGPEGGWTDEELTAMEGKGLTAVALTDTILRIETAAIVAAAAILLSANASR